MPADFGFIVCLLLLLKDATGNCYFAPELQGTFITQSAVSQSNEVLYNFVNITEDSIPIWGECYRKIENNVILKIDADEISCFRCFRMKLVSPNVLHVHTTDKDYISKCYTNEMKAISSCPAADGVRDKQYTQEIVLFKVYEYNGDEIRREYCPINGHYHFSYNIENEMATETISCAGKDSEVDNCPSGSAMNLRFRRCTMDNRDVTFECLGHWQGPDQQKYIALKNSFMDSKFGPQYRCATYIENPNTGEITMSLSSDSTCASLGVYSQTNRAESIPERSEVIRLYPSNETRWHDYDYCEFSDWMVGRWESVSIDAKSLVYRDHSSFKTYTMKCIERVREDASPAGSEARMNESKFISFSRTQCGEEQYHCVWVTKRSDNILEFQIGSRTIQHLGGNSRPDASICDDKYFDKTRWLTQGRLDHSVVSACPIDGDFEGLIPDAEGLCAKLWSECDRPDIMFYQVSACDYDEIFEEREYQCLGQWNENNLVYAFTKRRDVGVFECFVGTMATNQDIFIKEAGEHCQRDVDPNRYGMQLKQTKFCNSNRRKIAKMPSHKSIMQLIAAAAANGTDFGISLSAPIERHHINFDISMNATAFDGGSHTTARTAPANSTATDGIQFVISNETNANNLSKSDQYIVSATVSSDNSHAYSTTAAPTSSIRPTYSTINESDFNSVMTLADSSQAIIIYCTVLINIRGLVSFW